MPSTHKVTFKLNGKAVETAVEPEGTVADTEAELGIADWVDPETGIPAEEAITRLEDH